jgi:hypothetical protein
MKLLNIEEAADCLRSSTMAGYFARLVMKQGRTRRAKYALLETQDNINAGMDTDAVAAKLQERLQGMVYGFRGVPKRGAAVPADGQQGFPG